MKITHAEFRAAATSAREVPAPVGPELAIAGRSNVGKSSLINRLTGRKKLARTSSTPGCTRGLVFFDIERRLTLVDLPGYGWAKRSKAERAGWKRLVEGYISGREALAGVLMLIDVRRGPQDEEHALAAYLDAHGLPFVWVLTKCDKLSRTQLARRLAELDAEFEASVPAASIVTSARTGLGIDDLWKWMKTAVSTRRV